MHGAVRQLLDCLEKIPTVEISPQLAASLVDACRRLPLDCHEDFLSMFFVECLQETSLGRALPQHELRRLIWRVQKRIFREEQRHHHTQLSDPVSGNTPDHSVAIANREQIDKALSSLTPEETVMVDLLLLGHSQAEIAAAMRSSRSKVSRHLRLIYDKLRPSFGWQDPVRR